MMQNQAPPPDPKAIVDQMQAQATLLDAQNKQAELNFKIQNAGVQDQNRDKDREANLRIEQMRLQHAMIDHSADRRVEVGKYLTGLASSHIMQHADHQHDMNGQVLDAHLGQMNSAQDRYHDVQMASMKHAHGAQQAEMQNAHADQQAAADRQAAAIQQMAKATGQNGTSAKKSG
jgi:hypothetical protein